MRMLRLPSARPVSLRIPSRHGYFLTSFAFARLGSWSSSRCAWALVFRFRHLLRLFLEEGVSRISQVPRESFSAFALLSDPGRFSTPSASMLPPAVMTTKAPTLVFVSRLKHTALAPTPYASCRHHCRLHNVRFRLVASDMTTL
jgi:hypothetical protein